MDLNTLCNLFTANERPTFKYGLDVFKLEIYRINQTEIERYYFLLKNII